MNQRSALDLILCLELSLSGHTLDLFKLLETELDDNFICIQCSECTQTYKFNANWICFL